MRDNLEPEDIFIDNEILDNEFNEIFHQNILNTDDNFDFKIINEEEMNADDEVQITGQTPRHLRDRLARKLKKLTKEKEEDEVQITRQTPHHSKHKLARCLKK